MSLRAARLCGIALLFAVGLLAVLLAAGVFAPSGVGAHDCVGDADMHGDFHEIGCLESGHDDPHEWVNEEDGGRDRELEFRVYPPRMGSYLDNEDQIKITLPDFDLSETDFTGEMVDPEDAESTIPVPFGLIEILGSDDEPVITEPPEGVDVSGDTVMLTLPTTGLTVAQGEYLIIRIKKGTGILTPETPKGFDGESDGYEVKITFIDCGVGNNCENSRSEPAKDENFVVVKNPVSSTVPGTVVRIDLETYANVEIPSNEEITVDFSGPSADTGFILPSTISTSRIKIRSAGETFDPADVLVQGEKVTLTVPDDENVAKGDFAISFSQLARIRTPYSAGNRVITVSSFAPNFDEDKITAVIRRTTTVNPLEGPRGSEFTLSGKGYAAGTVTIFEAEADEIGVDLGGLEDPLLIDPGETLASVKTSRGSFTAKLEARGEPGESTYKVWTRDSNGAIHSAVFDIRSSMTFEPLTVGTGDRLTIVISDWEEEDDHRQEVAAVHIGGEMAFIATPIKYQNCINFEGQLFADLETGLVSIEVTVPQGVPPGEQTVAVYGHDELILVDKEGEPVSTPVPCVDLPEGTEGAANYDVKVRVKDAPNALVEKTVEIVAQALTVSPTSAVRGQKVAIRGSGFTQRTEDDPCPNLRSRDDICSITIDGKDVEEEPSQFEVSHDGTVAFTVTVPLDVRAGENEVQVTGWDDTLGTGTLTVPEPAIAVDPPQGQRGERVTVMGSGFAANGIFLVSYGDGGDLGVGDETVGAGQSDARGNFEVSFRVPLDADIGRTYRVSAFMEYEDGETSLRFEA